ncbi:MAG: hypothetical protein H6500_01405 [Candidatus Woesearchaeota archaeon]|nr:MAG: hypothetical protein H6500_01405 [Candidatus Woesearchaeota archaeon]
MEEYFIEKKSEGEKLLDLLVFFAVFVVTVFLVLQMVAESGKVQSLDPVKIVEIYNYVNIFVFLIFAADLVRLWNHSEGWGDFFKNNWLDILATIPFGLIGWAFAGASSTLGPRLEILKWTRFAKLSRVGKLTRISKISKISKEFKAAAHLKKEREEYRKKHRL